MSRPRISVILVSYNMRRELPRTVFTFCAPYQRGLAEHEIELIVVDNGSTRPADEAELRQACPQVKLLRVDDGGVSPVTAINRALALASGELIGVCIDGARMASPGLLAAALEAARLHPRPAIGTLAFHLGPDVQAKSMLAGYDQAAEDQLLATVDWRADGYRLFDISVLASSSAQGWFVLPSETNALFLHRGLWDELGGYEPRFQCPGGGLVNLDTWQRACVLPDAQPVLLLGEATFHQFHGGVATNSPVSRWQEFHDEYAAIRGQAYQRPRALPLVVGRPRPGLWPSLRQSSAGKPPG
jgi:hypothetical protein